MDHLNEMQRRAAAARRTADARADIRRLKDVAPDLHPAAKARAMKTIANLEQQLKDCPWTGTWGDAT